MGVDSELHVSWETLPGENPAPRARHPPRARQPAGRARRRRGTARCARSPAPRAWSSYLDGLVARGRGRLRALPPPTAEQARALEMIDPKALPFDPESELDPDVVEAAEQRSLFRVGIRNLWARVTGDTPGPGKTPEKPLPPAGRPKTAALR